MLHSYQYDEGEEDYSEELFGMSEESAWIDLYPQPYCYFMKSMTHDVCFERSILELWGVDGKFPHSLAFNDLTTSSILEEINHSNHSGVFNHQNDFKKLLGGVEKDSGGNIVTAKAAMMFWFTKANITKDLIESSDIKGDLVDPESYEFEQKLLDVLNNKNGYPEGLVSFASVESSQFDVMTSHVYSDSDMLGIGYIIVLAFVQTMLSQRIDCISHRFLLSMVGISCVAMGVIVSYGVGGAVGLKHYPPHTVLPFLFLGFGIDDMFVIVQCWNNLSREELLSTRHEKFGYTMKRAGVAITITTVTDVVAFGIGSMTEVPALKSFCIFACTGMFAIYFFQTTMFVAAMSLDQRRIDARRNGCIPCLSHRMAVSPEDGSVHLRIYFHISCCVQIVNLIQSLLFAHELFTRDFMCKETLQRVYYL